MKGGGSRFFFFISTIHDRGRSGFFIDTLQFFCNCVFGIFSLSSMAELRREEDQGFSFLFPRYRAEDKVSSLILFNFFAIVKSL